MLHEHYLAPYRSFPGIDDRRQRDGGGADIVHIAADRQSRVGAPGELLGIPLFDRVRGRLQPNAQAIALYEEVQRSYVGLERVVSVASRLKQFAQGQISVICLPVFSQVLLPSVCARFLAEHEGVSVAITPQDSPFLEEWLAAQSYDLGLTSKTLRPPAPNKAFCWRSTRFACCRMAIRCWRARYSTPTTLPGSASSAWRRTILIASLPTRCSGGAGWNGN